MLEEKFREETKEALKKGDSFKVSVLRMAQAAFHNKALEKRAAFAKSGEEAATAGLNDDEIVAVLRSEVKKRRDAAEEYKKGNRPELFEKEQKEVLILQEYLPAEIPDEAIDTAVRGVVGEVGADPKQFGKIMGLVMKKLGTSVSGDRVSHSVKRIIRG